MPATKRRRSILLLSLYLFASCILFIIVELVILKVNGTPVARPTIPRNEQQAGTGQPVRYIVMGDSTAIAQGADYQHGYAVATVRYLAQHHAVTWKNIAVSGARAHDVRHSQLPQALAFKADIALVAVGANDVTHLTATKAVRTNLEHTILTLRAQNPHMRIILTGAPAMGTVPRFPWPVQQLAGKRTKTINTMVEQLAQQKQVTFAPIAEKTAAIYRQHPEYFAVDKFHPNDQGYQPWIPVLTAAIDASRVDDD